MGRQQQRRCSRVLRSRLAFNQPSQLQHTVWLLGCLLAALMVCLMLTHP